MEYNANEIREEYDTIKFKSFQIIVIHKKGKFKTHITEYLSSVF